MVGWNFQEQFECVNMCSHREVVILPLAQMQEVVGGGETSGVCTIGHIRDFFCGPGDVQEKVNALKNQGVYLSHCEISEGCLVYIPPGWILAEKTLDQCVIGIAAPLLTKSLDALLQLKALRKGLSSMWLAGPAQTMSDFVQHSVSSLEAAMNIAPGQQTAAEGAESKEAVAPGRDVTATAKEQQVASGNTTNTIAKKIAGAATVAAAAKSDSSAGGAGAPPKPATAAGAAASTELQTPKFNAAAVANQPPAKRTKAGGRQ